MSNWLLQLAVVILVTSACGVLARRIGQGKVVGELIAGLLLGPSVLGAIGGAGYRLLFNPASATLLSKLGELGLVFLMFQTGAHIVGDMPKTRTAAWPPFVIAAFGMAVPFGMGCALASFGDGAFVPPHVPRIAYVLFCGIALSVSALPVMARIVTEAGIAQHHAARLSILAATVTDAVGWLLLAGVGALAKSGFSTQSALYGLLQLAGFFAVSVTIVRLAMQGLLEVAKRSGGHSAMLVCALCYVLLSAWAATAFGLHSAFGALIAAVNMSRRRDLLQFWQRRFSGLADVVLTPLFFVSAGMQASVSALHSPMLLAWLALFFAAGVAGKYAGCYIGARLCKIAPEDSYLIGVLMNSRGTVELMVLSIGLQLQLISASLYTVLLIATLATTAASAQLAHRWARKRDPVRHAVPAAAG
ncbi:sodium:proton exchanger [Trinickia dabaoshanensis]|uniref:Sodium:proton exchanger n=1 Tax=Trinickia dabaoshanensis TaxID=564714 RepID=A0A2N7VJ78_9BURK|nr:cation:proton antiporter [Trinickia dabaoshanensis]PMS17215.1 sodium:proton exchanger [Trinickia dabaoshanensis]